MAPHVGRFGDLYAGLLGRGGGAGWQFDIVHTAQGGWPDDIEAYDAVVLTGSRYDSFADTPWIAALRARIAALIAAGRTKVVGICFGHQLIACSLGAPVQRASCGWTIGRVAYAWHGDPRLASGGRSGFGLLAAHQDQVLALPSGARLLASAPACPIAGFTLGDHVLSLQPHPELDETILARLIDLQRPDLGAATADAARASLALGHDGEAIGRLIVEFLAS